MKTTLKKSKITKKPRKRIVTRKLTTKMEAYRLWFEYLKLVLVLIDPSFKTQNKKVISIIPILKNTYSKNNKIYKDWNITKDTKFNDWWETHSKLFQEKYNVRQIMPGQKISSPDAILVEIPLNRSATEISKRVMDIVIDAQALTGLRSNKKSKIIPTSTFQLTTGSEPKVHTLNDMLIVFRDVYCKQPVLKGTKLVEAIYDFYTKRRKGFNEVPKNLIEKQSDREHRKQDKYIAEIYKRTANRYINNAFQILINVAAGEFPGKYGSAMD
ncbi:hypothetical protein EB001_15720 [bacterium]|nr:hypothetical protein [bacterium]